MYTLDHLEYLRITISNADSSRFEHSKEETIYAQMDATRELIAEVQSIRESLTQHEVTYRDVFGNRQYAKLLNYFTNHAAAELGTRLGLLGMYANEREQRRLAPE